MFTSGYCVYHWLAKIYYMKVQMTLNYYYCVYRFIIHLQKLNNENNLQIVFSYWINQPNKPWFISIKYIKGLASFFFKLDISSCGNTHYQWFLNVLFWNDPFFLAQLYSRLSLLYNVLALVSSISHAQVINLISKKSLLEIPIDLIDLVKKKKVFIGFISVYMFRSALEYK